MVRRPDRSLASLIREESRLSHFGRCLLATGLFEDLDEGGSYTVFAPLDSAFELSPTAFEGWFARETTSLLFDVAEFHVTRGIWSEPPPPGRVPSLEGRSLTLEWASDRLLVNRQALVQETWLAKNGLLHLTDKLLIPSGIQLEPDGSLAAEAGDRPSGMRLVYPSAAENLGVARQFE